MTEKSYRCFPHTRMRRLRTTQWMRDLVAETELNVQDLIWPVFVRDETSPAEIASMPGVRRYTVKELVVQAQKAYDLGIRVMALFPLISKSKKTDDGREALNPENLICQALSAVKKNVPEMGLIADVALDPFTTHGHDGMLVNEEIVNDASVKLLALQAVNQASAGADILAPSDMMDGRVKAIRRALDEAGYVNKAILSYAAKYASAFYGPFREAVGAGKLAGQGDKKTYQMNPANKEEALHEVALDLNEGADLVMVKPGLPYLDVISAVKEEFKVPVFAYQVSGEYSMLKAAGKEGWLDYDKCLLESLLSFKRAGATAILTYGALEAARLLQEK